ncbi:hypothetical protein D3C72_1663000 [compost metagenome]
MFWSTACLRMVRLSCGDSLLSNPTTSNLCAPAQFFWLATSATYCQLLSWFCPTGAISPDSGSMKAIFTVSAAAMPETSVEPSAANTATPATSGRIFVIPVSFTLVIEWRLEPPRAGLPPACCCLLWIGIAPGPGLRRLAQAVGSL